MRRARALSYAQFARALLLSLRTGSVRGASGSISPSRRCSAIRRSWRRSSMIRSCCAMMRSRSAWRCSSSLRRSCTAAITRPVRPATARTAMTTLAAVTPPWSWQSALARRSRRRLSRRCRSWTCCPCRRPCSRSPGLRSAPARRAPRRGCGGWRAARGGGGSTVAATAVRLRSCPGPAGEVLPTLRLRPCRTSLRDARRGPALAWRDVESGSLELLSHAAARASVRANRPWACSAHPSVATLLWTGRDPTPPHPPTVESEMQRIG